jgi:hypothetical protein
MTQSAVTDELGRGPTRAVANVEGFFVVAYPQIATADDRELRLQDRPAVYSWQRLLQLDQDIGDPHVFVARIYELLSCRLSPAHLGTLGFLYELTLQESPGKLSGRSSELLEAVSRSQAARAELAAILAVAAPLQAPLYIGKTLSLRRRVGEHVSGGSASELRTLLSKAGIRLDQCFLRYRYLDNADSMRAAVEADLGVSDSQDAVCLLVEELLTRLSPAAFVRRPG